MTKNKSRTGNQPQPRDQSERSSAELVRPPVPSLIEGTKTEVIYYKPEEDQDVPKNRFTRFLYYRSQIVLGFLTFGILVFYLVQWIEFRSAKQLENRAYVAPVGVTWELIGPSEPTTMGIWLNAVNSGRTPGINGSILIAFERRQGPPPEDQVINQPDSAPSRIIFGSQTPVKRLAATQPVQQPEPSPSPGLKGKPTQSPDIAPSPAPSPTPRSADVDVRPFFLYGVITYDDIFGVHHRTKFCFTTPLGGSTWWYCSTYNDAD